MTPIIIHCDIFSQMKIFVHLILLIKLADVTTVIYKRELANCTGTILYPVLRLITSVQCHDLAVLEN